MAHGIAVTAGQSQPHLLPVRMVAEIGFTAVRQYVAFRIDKGDPKPGKLFGKSLHALLVDGIIVFVKQVHINFQIGLGRIDEIFIKNPRGKKGVNEQYHRHDQLGNPQYFLSHILAPFRFSVFTGFVRLRFSGFFSFARARPHTFPALSRSFPSVSDFWTLSGRLRQKTDSRIPALSVRSFKTS